MHAYFEDDGKRLGRKRKLDADDDKIVSTYATAFPKPPLGLVAQQFSNLTGTVPPIGRHALRSSNKRSKLTDKPITLVPAALLNSVDRLRSLELLANYHVHQMHDFDESVAAMKSYLVDERVQYSGNPL